MLSMAYSNLPMAYDNLTYFGGPTATYWYWFRSTVTFVNPVYPMTQLKLGLPLLALTEHHPPVFLTVWPPQSYIL